MKKTLLFVAIFTSAILFSIISDAQTTFAGGGTSTADGIPATSALIGTTSGVGYDANYIYIMDDGHHKLRRVNKATGLIYTVAGSGSGTYSGDGGPATAAGIGETRGIYVDNASNVYIADWGSNNRIRKVDAASGIITTVAGGGTSAADSVPATSENLGEILCVFVDASGNIYVQKNNGVGKVDATTGIITTIAGGGTSTAEWVPATSAQVGTAKGIVVDNEGNIYITYGSGDRIRRVDAATGLIHTVAGLGTGGTTDGILATNATLADIHSCTLDMGGNIYIADRGHDLIRKVDASTGLINTIATDANYEITADAGAGYLYYSNFGSTFRELGYPLVGGSTSGSDTFTLTTNANCNGVQLIPETTHYIAGRSVKTFFGDGTTDSSTILHGVLAGAYAVINHSYSASGTYTIKQFLYSGATIQDSATSVCNYTFCRTLPVRIYYDANGNCVKDAGESFMTNPILAVIDSNGIPVDTISVTSGFDYDAHSHPGDIYSFRILPRSGLVASCPADTVISDTVISGTSTYPDKYYGLACSSSSSFDLDVKAVIPVTGEHDQWGNIYVRNNSCLPTNATVTLYFSTKYTADMGGGALDIHPAPSSYTSNSITWNLTGLSSALTNPVDLYYAIWDNPSSGYLAAGDTVMSHVVVTPISGDSDPSNNECVIWDTVKAGVDPNEISVYPAGCLASGDTANQLTYTINFTNTGTDTAYDIVVLDTLSDALDTKSLRIINASAVMNVSIMHNSEYYVAQFSFPAINLLDSAFNSQACNGSVIFTINTKQRLGAGVTVFNRAGVYFDFNPVVMTNQVENVIGCSGGETTSASSIAKKDGLFIFPNPTTNELTIQSTNQLFNQLTITNSIGQTMMQQPLTLSETKVNVSALPAGLYYITFRGDNGTEVRKFVKM